MSELPASLPEPSDSSDSSQPSPACLPVETPAAQMAQSAAEELSGHQRRVMSLLAAGNSVAKSAQLAQVGRRTVYRWLKEDATFRAVYNAWRRELVQSARTRMLTLADDAIDTIQEAIIGGNVNASLAVARSMGLLDPPHAGPDDPARIAVHRRAREMRQAAKDFEATKSARNSLPFDHPLRYTPEERAEFAAEDERRRQEYAKNHPGNKPSVAAVKPSEGA